MSDISAINVSDYLTNKAIEQSDPLTLMQALKLTYIAQGFHLSLTDKPFFYEKIEAWKHGPVIQELYDHLRSIKEKESYLIKTKQEESNVQFNEKQRDILTVVFGKYAKISAWDLSVMTHKRGTPWNKTYSNNPYGVIDENLIKEHFQTIVSPRSFIILFADIKHS